jgi:2,4-dienoyl-CoA reductase-like NADH-dependent reductase (Old Yellow Enzyme family)
VGGWRHVTAMEEAVQTGGTDLISLCRPFIREPFLVRRIREEKVDSASCVSCNRCGIALARNLPVRCYCRGLPQ